MSEPEFKPGDIYEDCAFHPCLCTRFEEYNIEGISLIDGSMPRSCDIDHCGVRKLTLEEALRIKANGPLDPADRKLIPADKKWWR